MIDDEVGSWEIK